LESIEDLYTLKKVQNRVKDRVIPWIDFSAINVDKERNTVKVDEKMRNMIAGEEHKNNQVRNLTEV